MEQLSNLPLLIQSKTLGSVNPQRRRLSPTASNDRVQPIQIPSMRYRLRTLLIVLALGPVVLAGAWWGYGKWREEKDRRETERLYREGIIHPPTAPADPY